MAKNIQGKQVKKNNLWKIVLVIAIILIVAIGIYYASVSMTGNAVKNSVTVKRTVPSSCNLDNICTIKISVTGKSDMLGIEEAIPQGWKFVSSNPEVSISNEENGVYSWLFGANIPLAKGAVKKMTITYKVIPTSKTGSFSGFWTIDGDSKKAISGKSVVKVK